MLDDLSLLSLERSNVAAMVVEKPLNWHTPQTVYLQALEPSKLYFKCEETAQSTIQSSRTHPSSDQAESPGLALILQEPICHACSKSPPSQQAL